MLFQGGALFDSMNVLEKCDIPFKGFDKNETKRSV